MDNDYIYECLCMVGSPNLKDHKHLCQLFNNRRKRELEDAWEDTGIARYWREQDAMTGIERVNADR